MPTAGAILEAALGNLAVAAGLAVVAAVAGRWRTRPAVGHAAWLLVLVKLVTPPVVTIPVPVLPPAPPAAVVAAPAAPVVRPTLPIVSAPVLPVSATPAVPVSPPARPVPWPTLILAAWAAGVLVAATVLAVRVRRFVRWLRFAEPAPAALVKRVEAAAERVGLNKTPRVMLVNGPVSPFVWAVGRPTLYLPAGLLDALAPDQRAAVLAHELAHLRRRDHWVRWLEAVAVAAYWWCPLAWVARGELRRLEEEACDAAAVATAPGSAHDYAVALLDAVDYLTSARPAPPLAAGMGDVAALRGRIERLLAAPRPAGLSRGGRLALIVAGLAVVACGPKLTRLAAAVLPVPPALRAIVSDVALTPPTGEPLTYRPTPTRSSIGGTAAAVSADGSRVAVAAGAVVTVWDVRGNRPIATLTGHTDLVSAIAFAPDGRVATASHDGTAKLWASDGREVATLTGHASWVSAIAFAPDGRSVVTGGYDRSVRLWDAATGEPRQVWDNYPAAVRAVAFAPTGRRVAVGVDQRVEIRDAASGDIERTLTGHAGAVRAVAFAPDGRRLATGADDHTVRLWDAISGRELGSLTLSDYATAVRYSAGGRVLAAGTFGGQVAVIDPDAAKLRGYLGFAPGEDAKPAHAGPVAAVAPTAVGLVSVGPTSVAVWPPAGPPQSSAVKYPTSGAAAVAVSDDGRTVAVGGADGVVRFFDAATGAAGRAFDLHPGGVSAVRFAGDRLVSAGADEKVRVTDTTTGKPLRTLTLATADLRVAVSADGRTLAVGGVALANVTLLDLETGSVRRRLPAEGASAVEFHPDGSKLLTGHPDGRVHLWDAATGEELARTPGRDAGGRIDAAAFHPDGRSAAVAVNASGDASDRYAVRVWDAGGAFVDTPRPLAHPGPVAAVAFAPDGRTLLSAAADGHLHAWDAGDGTLISSTHAHAEAARALAVDRSAVYTAGDAAAKRWPMPARGGTP